MTPRPLSSLAALTLLLAAGCAHSGSYSSSAAPAAGMTNAPGMTSAPSPDPRVGLKAGATDAGVAAWNMRLVSNSPAEGKFVGATNSDLSFIGKYVIQGSYNGYQVWDVSDPVHPVLRTGYYCPASQSDVSVYKNLLFVSGEGLGGRIDCGAEGIKDTVSSERLRGIRIFDITDITSPKYITNVQTCRGSHTHTVVTDPKDNANVYVYVSGSAPVRSPSELSGCSSAAPDQDPNSARFRIEVIKVPLAHPEQAAIVSSPRIFNDLAAPATHAEAPEDIAEQAKEVAAAKASGGYVVTMRGREQVLSSRYADPMLDSIMKARGGTGAPSHADSAALHSALQGLIDARFGRPATGAAARRGPDQCHDITVYPAIGLAGGACGGYGLLLDINDPAHPNRLGAAADSNFSYWHSATFNNDGTKILFSDEWGGGGQPKCRSFDRKEWGADAIFTLTDRTMHFQSYYKMPAAQTQFENCVAHNGSLIPIPGRDVMVQSWYQGGVSIFDWTDAAHPHEIAFFDRGPVDGTRMASGGTWSAYWYNGMIYSSEISRGLDVFELTPNANITQNEIDAAKSVQVPFKNVQDQQKIVWPATFALARAYLDQLARGNGLAAGRIAAIRSELDKAEKESGSERHEMLTTLAAQVHSEAPGAADQARAHKLGTAIGDLANAQH